MYFYNLKNGNVVYGQEGSITRFEAGVLYRASKENKVKVLKETIDLFYNSFVSYPLCIQFYKQDIVYYDRIHSIINSILQEDYNVAQYEINKLEEDEINRASKKSRYYHLKNDFINVIEIKNEPKKLERKNVEIVECLKNK